MPDVYSSHPAEHLPQVKVGLQTSEQLRSIRVQSSGAVIGPAHCSEVLIGPGLCEELFVQQ